MDPLSRRSFLNRVAGAGVAASAFTIINPELVRGAGKEKLTVGLVGCGGRGTQAVANLFTADPNVELIAMGDVFQDRLDTSVKNLRDPKFMGGNARREPASPEAAAMVARIKVDPEHQFVGFDAYKKVIASNPDIVILATPPGYRPAHFEACIEAKRHVFCEKPFGTDAVGVRRMMDAGKKSEALKLTVVSGAQRRFHAKYEEEIKKVHDGGYGDIVATYAYWIGGPVIQQRSRKPEWGDMEWQHRAWYSHVWICGDQVVEQHLHNIDVCNWAMNAHPVKVVASGGAAWRPRDEVHGNIYDHITADFVYPNGSHMLSACRQYPSTRENRIYSNVSERIVGTKGALAITQPIGPDPMQNPYVREHIALVKSIRGDGPYLNQTMTVAESTLTCIMARESAYSGLEITWDQMMSSKQDLQPKEFDMKMAMAVPPLPVPGVYKFV